MRAPESPHEIGTPLGINTAVGAVVVVVCLVAPPHLDAAGIGARLAVLAVGLAAFAASVADPVASLVTAGVAFLLLDGFVVGHAGDLAWHGDADLVRLGVLAGAALAGAAARSVRDAVRRVVRRPVRVQRREPAGRMR